MNTIIEIPFPAHLNLFTQLLIDFSKFDKLKRKSFFEDNLDFVRTKPYNPRFEQFGYTTKNFLLN